MGARGGAAPSPERLLSLSAHKYVCGTAYKSDQISFLKSDQVAQIRSLI